MKVIDLYNRIVNGDELPEKIKYHGILYTYSNKDKDYFGGSAEEYYNDALLLPHATNTKEFLNEEIEIVEDTPKVQVEMTQEEYNEYLDRKLNIPKEDEKIEHLKLYAPYPECTDDRFEDVENKINEIIDKVNGK